MERLTTHLVSDSCVILTVPVRFAADGKTAPLPGREPGMTSHLTQLSGGCCHDGPPVDVTTWRRCRLIEAGVSDWLASRLAADREVDLHALLELVDRGCPPDLAARILSPIRQGATS